MKKLLQTMSLTALLLACLTGCGGGDEAPAPTVTPTPTPEVAAPAPTPDPGLEVLRVGMDLKFPPYSYMDDAGNPAGFEPTVAQAFADYLGMDVEIVNCDFGLLIGELEMGNVDVLIADMAATPERGVKVDFSIPYRYTNTLGLVNKTFAETHGITDEMPEADFFAIENARFVGLSGTKGVYYPQSMGVSITEVTEIGTGLIEVSSGMSDVLIASNEVYEFQAADPENTIVYAGIPAQDSSSFAVQKGDSEMLEQCNAFIATMYEEGGLYDQMAAEWDPIIAATMKNDSLGLDFITQPAG